MATTPSKIQIKADSELMKNQKHAVALAPQQHFQVLQTANGDAIFFSIGSEGAFYVTREMRASDSGWGRIDLSSSLTDTDGSAGGKAKWFAVSQNPKTLDVDVAVIVSTAGNDSLYVSTGNSCSSEAWADGISWTAVPFDAADGQAPSPFVMSDMYMLTENTAKDPSRLTWFVDIVSNPDSKIRRLERYFIEMNSTPKWIRHTLPSGVEEGSISSCLGRRQGDVYAGIYSFGKIGSSKSLEFTPTKNYWDEESPPETARLKYPSGTTAITSCPNQDGLTNLFVAADDGLYIFRPDMQMDKDTGDLIIPSSPVCNTNTFQGATRLSSSTTGSHTVVWGLNGTADLVYASCPVGEEAKPASWSSPMQIASAVSQFAFYLNRQALNNVVFALIGDQTLLQLTREETGGCWNQRHILLPTPETDKVFEANTFTTHVKCTDGNGVPAPQSLVTLESAQETSISVNNVYRKISPDSPLKVRADGTGSIVIVQETSSLLVPSLTVKCDDQTLIVNPRAKIAERLSSIKCGSDLRNVRFEDAKGQTRSLVSSDISSADLDAVAKCLPNLLEAQSALPSDGSKKTPTKAASLAGPGETKIWGIIKTGNQLNFVEGPDALAAVNNLVSPGGYSNLASTGYASYSSDMIAASAGDLFRFLGGGWDDVVNFFFDPDDGICKFIVHIGGKIFTAILDCVSAVAGAIEFVFNKIKVFFEDLVQWLGFMFSWDDILRTHRVMKNIFTLYAKSAVDQIDVLRGHLEHGLDQLQSYIDSDPWQKLQDDGKPIGDHEQETKVDGIDSPQINWAVYHTSNGLSVATTQESATVSASASANNSAIENLLRVLNDAVTEEEAVLKKAISDIKAEVFDKIHTMSPTEVVQRVLKVLGTFLIGTSKNILLKLLDLIKLVFLGILDILDAPLDIPIISPMYKTITGGDTLSMLDIICLIAAIPATLIYKLAANDVPFPDNSETQSLIKAKTFSELSSLLSEPDQASARFITADSSSSEPLHTATTLTVAKRVVAILKIGVCVVSTTSVAVSIAKREFKVSGPAINGLSMVLFLASTSPSIAGHFVSVGKWTYIGDVLLYLGLGRVSIDNMGLISDFVWTDYISPTIATTLGMVGFITAIWEQTEKTEPKASDTLGFIGRIFSSSSSMLTIMTCTRIFGPEVSVVAFGVSLVCASHSGILSASSGALILGGN
ncbi:hypothetical protein ANO14919_034400 [Xylariales sp. No.14919]|nr:hypothetical protein ANO14919_034400 [Xylariales sp. No.14919]